MTGLWHATVVRVEAGGYVHVQCPRLGGARTYGPLEGLQGVTLAAGDRLLVGLVEGDPNDLAIVRRLP